FFPQDSQELIYKRVYGKLNKALATVGPHFKQASNFLWPFKLSAPLGGLKKKRQFVEGGDAGNPEDYINLLVLLNLASLEQTTFGSSIRYRVVLMELPNMD
ncbi:hypothetical protein MKW94_023533, partial [Papaver nudicaule]|nr:hypothetical protein [Papaver nudicaule]